MTGVLATTFSHTIVALRLPELRKTALFSAADWVADNLRENFLTLIPSNLRKRRLLQALPNRTEGSNSSPSATKSELQRTSAGSVPKYANNALLHHSFNDWQRSFRRLFSGCRRQKRASSDEAIIRKRLAASVPLHRPY